MNTKIACLIDPEEEKIKTKIKLGVKYADMFFIGGSTNKDNVLIDLTISDILEEDINATIWIFAGSQNDIPTGVLSKRVISKVLIPIPINATKSKYIFELQIKNWFELEKDFGTKLSPIAYYILNPKSSPGKKFEIFTPSHLAVAKLAKECGFNTFYLEGTGGKFNPDTIKKVLEIWNNREFIYGGIDSKKKLEEVQEIFEKRMYIKNIIVIGNKFVDIFK